MSHKTLRPPRILSINNYNYRRGGSDAVFIDHDLMFSKNNWDTALFSMHHPKNNISPWSKYFVNELEFGNSYDIYQKIVMSSKVVYSMEARNKLNQLLNTFQPDIAHLHCIYHHISPSVLSLLQRNGVPCVMTAHDLKLACPAYKMLNDVGICEKCKNGNLFHVIKNRCLHNSLTVSSLVAIESSIHKLFRIYKKHLDIVVTPSKFFLNKLIEWGWSSSKLKYIPNFIDTTNITPNYDAGSYFLYFGRLAPEKGVDTLIKAGINSNVRLIIAGTGPFESNLKSLATDNKNISFVGYKSGKDLWDLILNSRAVVLPSEWYENAPISILEAYAAGKPVIGANIGGIPEMLQDEVTGLIFESGDSNDLSEKLSKLQSMPDHEVSSFGTNAREFVINNFSPERYLNSMLELYRSLGVNTK
ncbi:MAG: glycosyltransferase [Candidatus Thiodiazotropha taylori]|nr:glycosyltransferase [Candidatus Thiodiazotropha taylori]